MSGYGWETSNLNRRRFAPPLRGYIEALNLWPLFVGGLPHIVARLQIVPKAGVGSERVRQAQRHIRRNARRAVENARESGARDMQALGGSGYANISKVFAQYLARMRRIEHLCHSSISRDSPDSRQELRLLPRM